MAVRETESMHGGVSLSGMVLGFFEEGGGNEPGRDPFQGDGECSDEEGGGDGSESNAQERKAFWKTQHHLLQVSSMIHALL